MIPWHRSSPTRSDAHVGPLMLSVWQFGKTWAGSVQGHTIAGTFASEEKAQAAVVAEAKNVLRKALEEIG